MSTEFSCPICSGRFEDEDYCPVHGAKLVAVQANAPSPELDPEPEDGDAPDETAHASSKDESLSEKAPGSESSDSKPLHEGKLASFMSRLGLRPAGGKNTAKSDPSSAPSSEPKKASSFVLPDEVAEKGWKLAGSVLSSAAADTWPVEAETKSGQVKGYFHRYRTGSLTRQATYQHLLEITTPHLARVWAHGTTKLDGARADYDLVSLPKAGLTLDKWFTDTLPSEQRALSLAPVLKHLLGQLADKGVAPMVLEPSHLARTEDGELFLTTVGAIAEVAETSMPTVVQYRPEFARSALLHNTWVAPELVQQTVLSGNAAVFSVGQILAEAVWGQPCSHADLQKGAVPFHALGDGRLARILMGCLWPHSSGRWNTSDLAHAMDCKAADTMPAVSPWASLAPGASTHSFSFVGESYWRMEDLLSAAVTTPCWAEATNRISAILDWAEGTSWIGQGKLMREALASGRSADWVLVNLCRAVRPVAPLSWRNLDLTDAEAEKSLAGLAQGALHGNVADAATLRDLLQADLRGAFVPVQSRLQPEPTTAK